MDTSNLAKRMKKYEAVSKNVLMVRMPLESKKVKMFNNKEAVDVAFKEMEPSI